MDVIGEFCGAVGLNTGMCDFLRTAFDLLGIDLSNIEDELREKGRDQLADEIVDLVGADFPGGKKAARKFARNLIGKIEQRLFGTATASPSSPDARGLTTMAVTQAKGIVDPRHAGTAKVRYRCRDGETICVAEWTDGSRVLPAGDCSKLARPHCPSPFPAGTIVAVENDVVRVAIPKPASTGEGPEFLEITARSDIPPDVLKVMLRDFLRKTGQLPLYKDPIVWAIAAGAVTTLGGAVWIRSRRRG